MIVGGYGYGYGSAWHAAWLYFTWCLW